jgi:hypothetical protein
MGIGLLQDLYRCILTSWENADDASPDAVIRRDQLDGFQDVIGTILVLEASLSSHQIIALVADIPEDKFDVISFLQQMRSVLIPGTATPQMHKSFRDYIMSERAPPGFRILTRDVHFKIARSCLDIIVNVGSHRDSGCEYTVMHWYRHLEKAVEEGGRCDDDRMWTLLGEMVEEGVGERHLSDGLYGSKIRMGGWCR